MAPTASRDQSGDHFDVADLTDLETLDEQSLLSAVKIRYQHGQIYTYIGDILVAVNPFRPLQIYDQKHNQLYKGLALRNDLAPHIYWIANKAYWRMRQTNAPQAILMSGESGTGKTESTKFVIEHMALISSGDKEVNSPHAKLIKVSPLLEAFGNAKTIMNDNSSRFGKYIELHFGDKWELRGAKVEEYMLEKCRVVQRNPGDKNFHIFYYLMAGLSDFDRLLYGISEPEQYRILNNGSAPVFGDVSERQQYEMNYKQIVAIMKEIGFSSQDISLIWTTLVAILHLTNIGFVERPDSTGGATIANEEELRKTCTFLQIDVNATRRALTFDILPDKAYGHDKVTRAKTVDEASYGRDALAKSLYLSLFTWLVTQVNTHLAGKESSLVSRKRSTIGILDISGFENFPHLDLRTYVGGNGFEQLLINFANEHLQYLFNKHILSQDQEELKANEIDLSKIHYTNNIGVLELFEGNYNKRTPGLLHVIDDESRTPQSNELRMVERFHQTFGDNSYYERVTRGDSALFKVVHFAGEVTYNAYGFLEKNRDPLSADLIKLLQSSSSTGIASLLQHDHIFNVYGRQIKKTVIQSYRTSLVELVNKLSEAQPLFVRCLKPNNEKDPSMFDDGSVQSQMKYSGLLEVTKIKKNGFPVRIIKEVFSERYGILLLRRAAASNIEKILSDVNIKDAVIGTNKVFLKEWHRDMLDARLGKLHRNAQLIQQAWRDYWTRKQLNKPTIGTAKHQEVDPHKNTGSQAEVQHDTIRMLNRKTDAMAAVLPTASNDFSQDQSEHGAADDMKQDSPPSERSTLSNDNNEESKEQHPDQLAEDVASMQWWDVFRLIPKERSTSAKSFTGILRLVKIIIYILLLAILMTCLVVNKGSLVLVTSTLAQHEHNSNTGIPEGKNVNFLITTMVIIMCLPHAITFLIFVMKGLFGSQPWPKFVPLVSLLFVEMIQTLSTCGVVFFVLPEMDMIRGVFVMELVAYFPALFMLFLCREPCHIQRRSEQFLKSKDNAESRRSPIISYKVQTGLYYISIALALLVQVGGLVVVGLNEFRYQSNPNTTAKASLYFRLVNGDDGDVHQPYFHWLFPFFLLLKSFTWWENYIDEDWKYGGRVVVPFRSYKTRIHQLRQKATIFTSVWNIIIIVAFPLLGSSFRFPGFAGFKYSFSPSNSSGDDMMVLYAPMLANGLSSFVGFLFGLLACKLLMQTVSFTVPLLLASPLTAALLIVQCKYEIISDFGFYKWHCVEGIRTDFVLPDSAWQLMCCALFWLSLVVVTYHLWQPTHHPMERHEKLFVRPFYDPIFFSQHMMLNRRRCDNELRHNHSTVQLFPESDESASDQSVKSTGNKDAVDKHMTPMIYACATMWHETRNEMTQLLKSVLRMDIDQAARSNVKNVEKHFNECYEYETHILFDDAFEEDQGQTVPNEYVRQLYDVINEAASSVHCCIITLAPPEKTTTPYGGRITWTLPGGSKLFVHLKDKNKIRHKKRWSQCMYMYYLLGYKLVGALEGKVKRRTNKIQFSQQAQNTFILALDGDVDFTPEAVRLLVDQMQTNPKAASACGRIHPIGNGPVVWFQQFEYAIGHWLQKAAEHIYGCVLCSPGCFSLFRASALMDDNVMRRYIERAQTPREVVQFDQGEDRWLCTLLLQQGYQVTYCAAADALTYAPDTFQEFYNQRRRWMPSTMANIMDLLSSFKQTIHANDNMSYLYVLYQVVMFFASILGPGTVIMMLAGSFNTVLGTNLLHSYLLAVEPIAFFVFVCFTTKPNVHVIVAQFLSAAYSMVMMVVIIGTIINAITESWSSPSVIFLVILVSFFILSALFHPQEFFCLLPGVLYFLAFPSAYLLLPLYSLCNLNVVSWGTREKPQAKTDEELELERKEQEERMLKKKQGSSILKWLGLSGLIQDLKEFYNTVIGRKISNQDGADQRLTRRLDEMEADDQEAANSSQNPKRNELREIWQQKQRQLAKEESETVPRRPQTTDKPQTAVAKTVCESNEGDPPNLSWLDRDDFGAGKVEGLSHKEQVFWRMLIRSYLHPILKDKVKEKNMENDLKSLRTNIVFSLLMLNSLWVILIFQMQLLSETLQSFFIQIPRADNPDEMLPLEPLGFAFLVVFGVVLLLQFIGMLRHRFDTFCHIIARTELRFNDNPIDRSLKAVRELQSLGSEIDEFLDIPEPDYGKEDQLESDYEWDDQNVQGPKEEAANYMDHNPGQTPPPAHQQTNSDLRYQPETKYTRLVRRPAQTINQRNSLHLNFQRRYKHLLSQHKVVGSDGRPKHEPTFYELCETVRQRYNNKFDIS